MDDIERIVVKAKELGIEWDDANSNEWHNSKGIRLAAIFGKWYDDVVMPIYNEFPTHIVPNKVAQKYFKEWFFADPGTAPKPPSIELES